MRVDPAGAHTEVGQLGSALNRMLDRIAGALSARHASETRVRQFVADASHELRTPLAAIRGYTELAQRKRARAARRRRPCDEPGRVRDGQRMTQLVEDMLLLARLDAGPPAGSANPVDLSRLVVDAVSDAHVAGPDHEWSLDLPDEPVPVDRRRGPAASGAGEPAGQRQGAHPCRDVGDDVARAQDATVRRCSPVADDGPGIPADLQPEVFERFARGDSSRSRREPSRRRRRQQRQHRLGLAIVAAVVKAHDGTIEVRSGPGSTEFVVRLPGSVHSRRTARTNPDA